VAKYLWFTLPVFAFDALAFWWASRHVTLAIRRARWIKFATYVVIVHGVLAATVAGPRATLGLLAVILGAGLFELKGLSRRLDSSVRVLSWLIFVLVAVGVLEFAFTAAPAFVAYLYLVVAVFDGFSQASGQIAGRIKLAPTISPGKTVEGFVIGGAITIACAFLLRPLAPLSIRAAAVVGVVTVVVGLAGDLAASWIKRRAGVKDYGTILPGHGGVLDRFDSFLAVAAALSVVVSKLTSGSW
jgi:phosphatidate cytidylyltransferase